MAFLRSTSYCCNSTYVFCVGEAGFTWPLPSLVSVQLSGAAKRSTTRHRRQRDYIVFLWGMFISRLWPWLCRPRFLFNIPYAIHIIYITIYIYINIHDHTFIYVYMYNLYYIYMYVQIHVKKSVHYIALHLLTLDFVICNVIYIYIYIWCLNKNIVSSFLNIARIR